MHSGLKHCQSGGNIITRDSSLSAGMTRFLAMAALWCGKGGLDGDVGRPSVSLGLGEAERPREPRLPLAKEEAGMAFDDLANR